MEVDQALMAIRKKFPQAQYPVLDMVSLNPPPPPTSVVLPEVMQVGHRGFMVYLGSCFPCGLSVSKVYIFILFVDCC